MSKRLLRRVLGGITGIVLLGLGFSVLGGEHSEIQGLVAVAGIGFGISLLAYASGYLGWLCKD